MNTAIDYFAEIDRKEQILKHHTVKEMLKRYRKILTSVSRLKLKDIDVNIDAHFGEDFTCTITIFSRGPGNNRSFTIYSFWSVEKNNKIFDTILALIKKDDFLKVIEFKESEWQ